VESGGVEIEDIGDLAWERRLQRTLDSIRERVESIDSIEKRLEYIEAMRLMQETSRLAARKRLARAERILKFLDELEREITEQRKSKGGGNE